LAADPHTRAEAASPGALNLFAARRVDAAVAMLAAAAEELAHEDPDRALELEAQLVALAMYEPAAAAVYLPRVDRFEEDLAGDSTGARMMLCQLAFRRLWPSRDANRAAELAERALAGGRLLAERGADTPELGWIGAGLTLILADTWNPPRSCSTPRRRTLANAGLSSGLASVRPSAVSWALGWGRCGMWRQTFTVRLPS